MPETDETYMTNILNNNHTPYINTKSENTIGSPFAAGPEVNYIENEQMVPFHMDSILVSNNTKDKPSSFSKLVEIFDLNLELNDLKYQYLLKLIEVNKVTLSNDREGILNFFISKLSNEELNMTFPEWLSFTINQLTKNYKYYTNRKLELLDKEFLHTINIIDSLDINNENDLNALKTLVQFLENPGN